MNRVRGVVGRTDIYSAFDVLHDVRAWECGCYTLWVLQLIPPAMTPIWNARPHLCSHHATSKMPKEEK